MRKIEISNWNCANDDADSVRLDPPPESNRIATHTKRFAVGEAIAMLAKGGPMGAYLWSHLHGIHEGRIGESHYAVIVLLKDTDGFYYMISPGILTTVKGVIDKPERHRHCFIQFTLPDSQENEWLKMAIENNISLELEIAGDRDRNDIDWLQTTLKDIVTEALKGILDAYVGGRSTVLEVLRAINNGKQPPFLNNKMNSQTGKKTSL